MVVLRLFYAGVRTDKFTREINSHDIITFMSKLQLIQFILNHLIKIKLSALTPIISGLVKCLMLDMWCWLQCALEHASRSKSEVDYYWNLWNTISKCPLLHLKAVKVVGFRESCRSMKPLFKFLEFLLRNSRVLEEIAIQTSRYVTRGTLDEALKLLAVPTASPDAVVLFEPPHLWVDPLCMYQNSDPMNYLL